MLPMSDSLIFSYLFHQPPPSQNQPIPVHTPQQPYAPGGLVDRVDETKPSKPQKQVSETDLYLLTAIEKLVYRVDLMEKRLRKMEENVHFVLAGTDVKPGKKHFLLKNFTHLLRRKLNVTGYLHGKKINFFIISYYLLKKEQRKR